ncbi:hypothetical protein OIO90_006092 [Microbotryomycetes sp. JL221]|nr:hypothetical protein OIO90_006092 [Microbotryomycetes sp. JL221]
MTAAADACRLKGNAAFQQGNFQLALAHYTTAIAIDPSLHTLPLNRSLVYLKLGQYELAIKDATTAIKLEPANPKAYFRRAQAIIKHDPNELDKALQDFKKASQLGATEATTQIEQLVNQIESLKPTKDRTDTHTDANTSTAQLTQTLQAVSLTDDNTDQSPPSNPPATTLQNTLNDTTPKSSSFASMKATRRGREKSLSNRNSVSQQTSLTSSNHSSEVPKTASEHVIIPGRDATETNLHAPTSPLTNPTQTSSSTFSKTIDRPLTSHALELALNNDKTSFGRYQILKTINPFELPQLLGSSLSPELLVDILDGLSHSNQQNNKQEQEQEQDWKSNYMNSLKQSKRFEMIVELLDDREKRNMI